MDSVVVPRPPTAIPGFLLKIRNEHDRLNPQLQQHQIQQPTTVNNIINNANSINAEAGPSSITPASASSPVAAIPLSPNTTLSQPSPSGSSTSTTVPIVQPPRIPPPQPFYLPPPALPPSFYTEELLAPENFSLVSSTIYRSSFPKKKNFEFLKELGLKTVLTLILEEYPPANLKFLEENGIKFKQFGIPGNKEPFDQIPEGVITQALVSLLDTRNHPVLIHCNKGKHRTGCLVGCLRRLQNWSLTSTFEEYRRFSMPKSRSVDQQFIELFQPAGVWEEIERRGVGEYVPAWGMLGRLKGPGKVAAVGGTASGEGATPEGGEVKREWVELGM